MPALLLTGPPGCGKTTVLRRVAAALPGRARGFLTEEVRGARGRAGFRIASLDGREAVLARVGAGAPRIGRYAVDVDALERIALPELAPGAPLYLLDEIGPMECLSARFVAAARALLSSGAPVVATVHRADRGFPGEAKRLPGVEVREVKEENRDALPARVLAWVQALS